MPFSRRSALSSGLALAAGGLLGLVLPSLGPLLALARPARPLAAPPWSGLRAGVWRAGTGVGLSAMFEADLRGDLDFHDRAVLRGCPRARASRGMSLDPGVPCPL